MENNEDVNNQKEVDTEDTAEEITMETLLEQSDISLNLPRQGDVREGMIASVSDDEVLVSIGAKSEGVIPGRELSQLTEEQRENLQVGNTIKVFIVSSETRQGTVMLSLTRAMEEDDWAQAEELLKSKEAYEGAVSGYNKGGLIVNMGHLRGFVPASQISMSRRMTYTGDTPEQRWSGMVGEPMVVRIIEVDRQRRRLIMSEKAAAQESRETLKERLLEELTIGESRKGRVTSLAEFGAFVNINGADGLVHLSEISWERIEHPKEVLKVGEEVEVRIISIDRERRRIGLSIRRMQADPWEDYVTDFTVGQLVEGTITRLTKFGAFARINENLEGLIHVSELSDKRIEHPKEVVTDGDIITLRIIKIDIERRRIGLSLRKVESMKYSDLDWEMTLADIEDVNVVGSAEKEEESPADPPAENAAEVEGSGEDQAEQEDVAEVTEEEPAAEAEQEDAAEVTEEEPAAETEKEDVAEVTEEEPAAETDEEPDEDQETTGEEEESVDDPESEDETEASEEE